ncbi:transcription factor MYB33-like isoform X2 [Henckelia pumila]
MAFNGSGCSRSTSGTPEHGLKKTPWTPDEDNILRQYVEVHGEGNWGSIQEITGLNKSGRSCRNRWANYLRPNLKKGAFSAEEENLIIELHGKHGNKWAHIASQLHGRTDNEVKNYWNMRQKKCQRAGLAIHRREMHQINHPPSSSPSQTFLSHSGPGPIDVVLGLPSMRSPWMAASTLERFSSDNVITTPSTGAGDFDAMGSEIMQGPENQNSQDGFRFIDEELMKLLDFPLSAPLPEWDDLDPRPF